PSVPPPTLASTTPEDTITPETESTKTSTLSTATSVTPPTLASTTPEDTITPETESTKTSTLSTATSVPPPTLASTTPEISITPGTESIKTSTLSTATSVPPPTLASTTPEVAITPETESTKTSTLSTTTSVPSPALASTTPGVTITPETESTKTSTLSTTTSVPSPTSASTSPEIIFTPETESTKTSTLSTTTSVTPPTLDSTTPESRKDVQNSPRLEIRIINVEWQEELSDPTSQEFATVSTNIENEVTFLLLNVSDILTFFIKVEVIQFKRGSVISVFDLIFNGTAPEQEKTAISEIQKSVVQDQKIGDLDVKELLAATSSQKNPEVLYRDPCHFTRCPDRMYCKSFINEYCISVCNENPNYCPLGSQCVNMTDHQTNPFIKCQCPAGTSGPNCTTEVTIMPTNNQAENNTWVWVLIAVTGLVLSLLCCCCCCIVCIARRRRREQKEKIEYIYNITTSSSSEYPYPRSSYDTDADSDYYYDHEFPEDSSVDWNAVEHMYRDNIAYGAAEDSNFAYRWDYQVGEEFDGQFTIQRPHVDINHYITDDSDFVETQRGGYLI
ncbi:uncharacterized protein LOC100374256, partial [Saccoglossus kowalevskii]